MAPEVDAAVRVARRVCALGGLLARLGRVPPPSACSTAESAERYRVHARQYGPRSAVGRDGRNAKSPPRSIHSLANSSTGSPRESVAYVPTNRHSRTSLIGSRSRDV
jgi:hypothetical protein